MLKTCNLGLWKRISLKTIGVICLIQRNNATYKIESREIFGGGGGGGGLLRNKLNGR